tara:strand:+ start:132 stop:311 length:180 start_codon:yes stop_codon:yes gene_type:complete
MPKYRILATQPNYFSTYVEAKSKKIAVQLAQDNHENYEWELNDFIGDWIDYVMIEEVVE